MHFSVRLWIQSNDRETIRVIYPFYYTNYTQQYIPEKLHISIEKIWNEFVSNASRSFKSSIITIVVCSLTLTELFCIFALSNDFVTRMRRYSTFLLNLRCLELQIQFVRRTNSIVRMTGLVNLNDLKVNLTYISFNLRCNSLCILYSFLVCQHKKFESQGLIC